MRDFYGSTLARAIMIAALFGLAPATHANELGDCAGIAGAEARLACFDALAANSQQQMQSTTVAAPVKKEPALQARIDREASTLANPFSLTAHKPTYIMPMTYNSKKNVEPFSSAFPDVGMDDVEAKFQISFKAKLWDINDRLNLWMGYTQENWWQVYNDDESAPFRETNYQPEAFVTYATNAEVLGFNVPFLTLSLNHQSNGRGELLSRSWNRVIAGAVLEKGNFVINPRVWYRIPEDNQDDDNPRTDDFYGYGDVRFAYKWNDMTFSMLGRNNLRTDNNKGAVELDWSFPLNERFKGYVQYFYGYGESLIDYDVKTNRIGIGIMMTDWF